MSKGESSAYGDLEQGYDWTPRTKGKHTAGRKGSAEKDYGTSYRESDLQLAQTIIEAGKAFSASAVTFLKQKHPHAMRHLPDEPTAEQLAAALSYFNRHLNKKG